MTAVSLESGTGGPATGTAAGELRTMARGGALNFVGVACNGAMSFLLVVVFTKGLGARGYGRLSVAIALFTVLSNIGQLGADTGLLREIPRLLVQRRRRDVRTALLVSLGPVLSVGVLLAALAYLFAPQLGRLLIYRGNAASGAHYIATLAPFLIVGSAATVMLAGIRGFGHLKHFVLIQNIGVPAARPLLALGVILLGGATTVGVSLSWAAPLAAAFMVAMVFLTRFARRTEAAAADDLPRRPVREVAAEFWRFTSARGLAAALEVITAYLSLILVGAFRSAREAGVYSAVMRYVIMGTFAFAAVRVAIGPQIAKLLAQSRRHDAEEVYQTATWWLSALSWPYYLLLAIFAATVLRVFGHDFTYGATALSILCVAELVDMGTGNVSLVLLMGGRSSWNVVNIVLGISANLGLSLWLIPSHGVVGAAIAWASTIVVQNVAAVCEVRWLMHMAPFGPGYGPVLAAVGCLAGVALVVRGLLGPSPLALAVAVVAGAAVYLPLLWRFRHQLHYEILRDIVVSARSGRGGPAADPAAAAAVADAAGGTP